MPPPHEQPEPDPPSPNQDDPAPLGGAGEQARPRRAHPTLADAAWGLLGVLLLVSMTWLSASCRSSSPTPAGLETQAIPTAPLPGSEPTIRVRLAEAIRSVQIGSGAARGLIAVRGENGATGVRRVRGPLEIRYENPAWRLREDEGVRTGIEGDHLVLAPPDDSATLSVSHAAADEPIRISGGSFVLVPRTEGADNAFDLLAELPLETYLPGVLARELYADWLPDAYKAQAVAARSYALHELRRARAAGRRFDIESTTLDQVYAGDTSRAVALEAVNDTRGVILLDPETGDVLRAYYSSTCGDRPSSAAEVWPTTAGFEFNLALPLQGIPRSCACDDSPLHRWERSRSADVFARRLAAWGRSAGHPIRSLKSIASIEAVEVNAARRPVRYAVIERSGATHELSAEELRVAGNTPAAGAGRITRDTRLPSGDVIAVVSGGRITFIGRGFGHGVGLCQFGAQGFAEKGEGWRTMLERFYPGSERRKLW